MNLRVAVQMDPLETINIGGDSTFALMLSAQKRGHRLFHYLADALTYHDDRLYAGVHEVSVQASQGNHFTLGDFAILGGGAAVIQWPCGSAGNERFTVKSLAGGYVQFVAQHSGLCIAQSGTAASGALAVQLACNAGDTTQWSQVGSTLRNKASGACLDVPNNSTAQDIQLVTWTCNGGNNQNWTQLP